MSLAYAISSLAHGSRGLEQSEKGITEVTTLGGPQPMVLLNESGLYALIIRSNKPSAYGTLTSR